MPELDPRAFPEAISGDDWRVRIIPSTYGHTDFMQKLMVVPGGLEDVSHAVRIHEMAHVANTPPFGMPSLAKKYEVNVDNLVAAEDARMNHGIARVASAGLISLESFDAYYRGILPKDASTTIRMQENLTKAFKDDPVQALVESLRAIVANSGTDDGDFLYERVVYPVFESLNMDPSFVNTIRAQASRIMNSKLPTDGSFPPFRRTVELAKFIQNIEDVVTGDPSKAPAPAGEDGEEDMGEDKTKPRKEVEEALDELTESLRRWDDTHKRMSETGQWGKMTLERPELKEDQKIRKRYRKALPTDAGVMIGELHRLLTDGHVFKEYMPALAGTILIDCSSSMGLTPEDVHKLVMVAPAVTVALYGADRTEGEVRVVAERGKITTEREHFRFPGCNVIDGPALEWLGTQKGPRIWVSDGVVTGVGDQLAANLTLHAGLLCAKHRIVRVRMLREALPMMNSLSREARRRLERT